MCTAGSELRKNTELCSVKDEVRVVGEAGNATWTEASEKERVLPHAMLTALISRIDVRNSARFGLPRRFLVMERDADEPV